MENIADHDLAVNERLQNDATMLYGDFPPLLDFPCMLPLPFSSSSSPSALTPPPPSSSFDSSPLSSLGSSSSHGVMKEDVKKRNNNNSNYYINNQHDTLGALPPSALSFPSSVEISQRMLDPTPNDAFDVGIGDCMNVIEESFGFIDLLENNDFCGLEFIFQNHIENPLLEEQAQQHEVVVASQHQQPVPPTHVQEPGEFGGNNNVKSNNEHGIQEGEDAPDDEMRNVFLEWLKSNKDIVSAKDLRSVKFKKATIECAARRLGGGKEGMKKLLKLILEWVQISHLKNKKCKNNTPTDVPSQNPTFVLNPTPSFGTESSPFFNQSPWISQQPYGADPGAIVQYPQPMVGDPYTNGASNCVNGTHNHNTAYLAGSEYNNNNVLEPSNPWSNSHYNQSFGGNTFHLSMTFSSYGNHHPHQWKRLATKEARKKRMARQRKYFSHYRNHNHPHGQTHDEHQYSHQDQTVDSRIGNDNCCAVVAAVPHANPTANWVYPQAMARGAASIMAAMPVMAAEPPMMKSTINRIAIQSQNWYQSHGSLDRQSQVGWWNPEKNLKFLLQKVLKQSDVGSLGRIVLPKKEAEIHLPELEARDGISIEMEDIGTSHMWNMRYRYWPNNKSRMYVLENTGDFVRANALQEGDLIVIYSDVKCDKFMIRGVKVRQAGTKPETRKG